MAIQILKHTETATSHVFLILLDDSKVTKETDEDGNETLHADADYVREYTYSNEWGVESIEPELMLLAESDLAKITGG